MKYFVVLVWAASLATSIAREDGHKGSESALQLRQLNNYLHSSHEISLMRREISSSKPGFNILQRRVNSPGRSRSRSPNRTQQPQQPVHRPGSLTEPHLRSYIPVRSSARARGPAGITTYGMQGPRTGIVPDGLTGHLQDSAPRVASADATSPLPRNIEAKAKGRIVVAEVDPLRGHQGNIRTYTDGETTDIPVTSPLGEIHTASNPHNRDTTITASAIGGKVRALAVKDETAGNVA